MTFSDKALPIIYTPSPNIIIIMHYLKDSSPQDAIRWTFKAKASKRKQAQYLRSRHKAYRRSDSAVETWLSKHYFKLQTSKGVTNVRGIPNVS